MERSRLDISGRGHEKYWFPDIETQQARILGTSEVSRVHLIMLE